MAGGPRGTGDAADQGYDGGRDGVNNDVRVDARAGPLLIFGDATSVHMRRWVQAMAERGFDCVVGTRRPADLPGARAVVALRPGGDGLGWFAALPAVRALARRLRPRWVHGHYVTSYGLWAAACRGAVPAPVVLTAWGSDILVTPRAPGLRGRLMRTLVGWSLRRAALVTADARDVLDAIAGYRPAARCEQVLWGADTGFFVPGEPAPGFEIASLRNWEPNYRIDLVLDAVARLRAARPDAGVRLHLLGGGPDGDALQARAAALGLGDAARFVGRVDAAAMRATLQRCRVSVSVPTSDATSVSVLESMACGLPVLASDLPANRQWLVPEARVPAGDAAALAQALQRLVDDPAAAAAQGRRNRAVVEAQASRAVQMDRMAALYRALA
jgi:glycosyltransferase involved in cell wall biosynthesis